MTEKLTVATLITEAKAFVDGLPKTADSFGQCLYGTLLVNVARVRLKGENADIKVPNRPDPIERLNAVLEEPPFSTRLGMQIELTQGRSRQLVTVHYNYDDERERYRTHCEYGVFVRPSENEEALLGKVQWEALINQLADYDFFSMLYPKVRRCLIAFREREFPLVVTGKAGGKTFMTVTHLPELLLHHRYLLEFGPKKEAKIYTAVASKSDISNDRLKGIRSWPGNRRVSGTHWLQPFYRWLRNVGFLWKKVG